MKTPETIKPILLGGLLCLTLLAAACQTTAPTPPPSAVSCDKCRMVWVESPRSGAQGKQFGAYVPVKTRVMVCPDCESAIVTFFKTGQLKHHCSHCGGTLTHCMYH